MASEEEEHPHHHPHPFAFFHSYSTNNNHHHHFHHVDVEDEDHPHHPLNLSRLSMCTGGTDADNEEEEDEDEVEKGSNDGDADDEEFSLPSSDSEKEGVCLSLPSTPTRRRIRGLSVSGGVSVKEYVSENEALENKMRQRRRERRSSFLPEKWLERSNSEKKKAEEDEQQSGEGECVVITRPKGGRRSLCMDMEEVKACKDLGFELENEKTQMIEIPSRLTVSCCSAFEFNDTSSGGNSPISSWKISSPGDDPKEVKARLKVWAQAVALAASPH